MLVGGGGRRGSRGRGRLTRPVTGEMTGAAQNHLVMSRGMSVVLTTPSEVCHS